MTSNQVAAKLGVSENRVRKNKGVFRLHTSYFFYPKNVDLVGFVKEKLPEAQVIESGNHWHEFVGGAKTGSVKDSFVWVKFKI